MIGNTIEFLLYKWGDNSDYEQNKTREERTKTGRVVDAFTEVSGSTSGKSEVFLGFGGGSVSGRTSSNRKYKIEYSEKWSDAKYYVDIYDWQMIKIIQFPTQSIQETNEEKFNYGKN